MKTLSIARGIAGVLSLVGVTGLVGCGAETGAPEAQIGVSSEALSVTTAGTMPTAVKAPGHCKAVANSVEYFLLFGGFLSNGSATTAIQQFTVANGWSTSKLTSNHATDAALSLARGQIQALPFPGDPASCLLVGGASSFDGNAIADNTGSSQYTVEKVTVDSSGFLTVTDLHSSTSMAQLRRTRGEIRACSGGNLLFYFGGIDDSGNRKNTVMKFDVSSPGTAWSAVDVDNGTAGTQNMLDEHADFGLVQDGDNFVVGGGLKAGGISDAIELFKTTSNCSTWTTATGTLAGTNPERKGTSAVIVASHKYSIAGGVRTTAATGNTTEADVDWTGTNPAFAATFPKAGTALNNSAVTYRPAYLSIGSTGFVLGGLLGAGATDNTFSTDAVQKSNWSSDNLSTSGRYAAAAEVLTDNSVQKIYLAAGAKIVTSGGVTTETVLNTTDVVTP